MVISTGNQYVDLLVGLGLLFVCGGGSIALGLFIGNLLSKGNVKNDA